MSLEPPFDWPSRPRRFAAEALRIAATAGGVLVAWQVITLVAAPPTWLLPSPVSVAAAAVEYHAYLAGHLLATIRVVILGFAIAVVLGGGLGVVIGSSRLAEQTLLRLLVGSQSIPKIAIAPLLAIWLGLGELPKIVMTLILCFFPVTVAMVQGLHATNRDVLELADALGASSIQSFRKIRFPSALPYLFAGLKIAASLAVIGAVVGEFIGGDEGLGYVLLLATAQVQGSLAYAALVLLALTGILLFAAVSWLERLLVPWAKTTHQPDLLESVAS